MGKTTIAWCTDVWNPVTGCSKVSAGCKHCYAEGVAERFWGGQTVPDPRVTQQGTRPRKFTDVQCHPERLDQPLRWRKPRRIFVNSMSDLFHDDVPDDFIAQVFAVMALAPRHTFQILTKRPERMRALLSSQEFLGMWSLQMVKWAQRVGIDEGVVDMAYACYPLPRVWLGVSAEDQPTFDLRGRYLMETPAAVRFVSLEPMLGAIDASHGLTRWADNECPTVCQDINCDCPEKIGLDWVIVGGESGPKARPFDIQWARDIVRQCEAAGVSVFVKQLGARPVWRPSSLLVDVSEHMPNPIHSIKHRAGADPSEWPADLRVQQFPEVA